VAVPEAVGGGHRSSVTAPAIAPVASLVRLRSPRPPHPLRLTQTPQQAWSRPRRYLQAGRQREPLRPPPEVLAALGSLRFPNVYPDPTNRALREALAERENVDAANLLVGCGADELIDLLLRCVLEPGDVVVDCPPTFTMYAFDADVSAGTTIAVPRNPDDFSLDLDRTVEAIRRHRAKVIFLTSPNNPDGSLLPDDHLAALLREDVLVVLDEAYSEFSGVPSKVGWVARHENLVVLRTFSKSAALAGLRVGWGAFPSRLIEYLWRAKQPYNVGVASETAALAALSNPTYLEDVRNKLVAERERMRAALSERHGAWLTPYPSAANFVLCGVDSAVISPVDLQRRLAEEHGVMVRHYAKPLMESYVRVSVGRPDQTDRLMAALEAIVPGGGK